MNSNVFQALQVIINAGAHFEAINTLVSDVERQYGLAMNDIKTLKTKVEELLSTDNVSEDAEEVE